MDSLTLVGREVIAGRLSTMADALREIGGPL